MDLRGNYSLSDYMWVASLEAYAGGTLSGRGVVAP